MIYIQYTYKIKLTHVGSSASQIPQLKSRRHTLPILMLPEVIVIATFAVLIHVLERNARLGRLSQTENIFATNPLLK